MRLMVEDANGLRSAGQGDGHLFLDITNSPMPTIQAGRPVRFYIENSQEREREKVDR